MAGWRTGQILFGWLLSENLSAENGKPVSLAADLERLLFELQTAATRKEGKEAARRLMETEAFRQLSWHGRERVRQIARRFYKRLPSESA
jgi:hypothetical protein